MTWGFQFQPRVWLELILTETGPAGTGRGVMAKELKHRGFASFKLLCSRLPTQPEHPLLQVSTPHPRWDSHRANSLVECGNDHQKWVILQRLGGAIEVLMWKPRLATSSLKMPSSLLFADEIEPLKIH